MNVDNFGWPPRCKNSNRLESGCLWVYYGKRIFLSSELDEIQAVNMEVHI